MGEGYSVETWMFLHWCAPEKAAFSVTDTTRTSVQETLSFNSFRVSHENVIMLAAWLDGRTEGKHIFLCGAEQEKLYFQD